MQTLLGTWNGKAIQEMMQNSFPIENGCNSWVFNIREHLLTQTVPGILTNYILYDMGWNMTTT